MDDFKKYMRQHASQMEFDEPGEAVWKNIAKKTEKTKPARPLQLYLRLVTAACFIVLAGSIYLLVSTNKQIQFANILPQHKEVSKPVQPAFQNDEPIQNDRKTDLVKQAFENLQQTSVDKNATTVKRERGVARNEQPSNAAVLENIATNFSQLVGIQLNKVRALPLYAEGPEYFSEFKKQFQQLEEDEKELKKTIQRDGLINDNLENLINVCQQKLNLLKLLQNEINKTNSRYRQNNNSDTANPINHINI